MPPNKTSFKNLLKSSGSNPMVNLQSVRAQREVYQQLRQTDSAPASKKAKTAAAAAPPAPPPPGALAALPLPPQAPARAHPPPSIPGGAQRTFEPAGMFAGRRPGFVFKMGSSGLGYYRDESSADEMNPPAARSGGLVAYGSDDDEADEDQPADAADAASALPGNFFDNPQADVRNKGKAVAVTQKEQTLKDELADFERAVADDLVAADDADDVAEEDEEEAKLREAVSVARELEQKIASLKQRREDAESLAVAAAAKATQPGASSSAGASPGVDDDDDDDDDDESALNVLDWRAKGL